MRTYYAIEVVSDREEHILGFRSKAERCAWVLRSPVPHARGALSYERVRIRLSYNRLDDVSTLPSKWTDIEEVTHA
jgi:hypothetical protein